MNDRRALLTAALGFLRLAPIVVVAAVVAVAAFVIPLA